ncbi:UDP-N-acetylglucosamine 1-carboxyvinyltransferase [Metallumcola ferriviriculae]|uniref:UDP-N-acetylglucosamine 1-carboxyvinyltransferase n=1 Tax=Metallumcola ferriviriculae TaxID=3039180 RepID=A0AAU0UKE6_9FIRM|nr:UDP-N-acetylglucosamine 1-carboxyvinyltransferase [Desulfitibacteraceae bacterium MK1]
MSKFIVRPNGPLKGKVNISGAKNAALAILPAALMAPGRATLENVPDIEDTQVMVEILKSLGVDINRTGDTLHLDIPDKPETTVPYPLAKTIRASNLLLGALLARCGRAAVPMPGGCDIGARPIDLHLKGFQAMGAEVTLSQGAVVVEAKQLYGAKVYLDFPSVGATENIMMAACFAEGKTTIENAAKEPEIVDLANFLNALGAKVRGAGTDIIRITGMGPLKPVNYSVIPDRIEAGTFMVAAAITCGEIQLTNVISTHLQPLIAKLKEVGVNITDNNGLLTVRGSKYLMPADIKTLPYPGFPTDLQSPMMALLTMAEGTSIIVENIFENRLGLASELKRLGASIKIEGHTAIIQGVSHLTGAKVRALDLRAGAALVLSGLVASGETEVCHAKVIERGYQRLDEKLRSLGADVELVK